MCLPQMLRTVQHRAEVIPAGRVDTLSKGLQASRPPMSCHACSQAMRTNASTTSESTNAPRALGIPSRLRSKIL